ncbi:hydrogenase maturation protease [Oscillatoria salina]|uniref:hydrogenase maturation protease n=1 Tax=Oscillatoria salina TaxID=331517 RepID=UPI001CCDF670|nr:hydrogenase maturation protease [Oscillatoria salina]
MATLTMILVIGYGNDLRSDDAVGRRVAEVVSQWDLPDVTSISVHQLTPELSETLSGVEIAIFVDASTNGLEEVTVNPITPLESGFSLTHGCDPRSLLTLAQILYGNCPQAWLVQIPVSDLSIGESLSAIAQTGITQALAEIRRLIPENTAENLSVL